MKFQQVSPIKTNCGKPVFIISTTIINYFIISTTAIDFGWSYKNIKVLYHVLQDIRNSKGISRSPVHGGCFLSERIVAVFLYQFLFDPWKSRFNNIVGERDRTEQRGTIAVKCETRNLLSRAWNSFLVKYKLKMICHLLKIASNLFEKRQEWAMDRHSFVFSTIKY